jgi:lysophospholipase L1-like esterase
VSRLPFALTAPLVLAQARRLSASTPRLPPPPEPWTGQAGAGSDALRLLVLGDSTAIGTGADAAADGLAGRLARLLGDDDPGTTVTWRALGRNGATAGEVRAEVLPAALDDPAELVVVVVGWNDALRLRSPRMFARELTTLVRTLAARRLDRRVVVVAAPRFDRLAVLPQPMRWALGAHAAGIRAAAARVCARWGVPLADGFDGRSTASDRFHPDCAATERMAAAIVRALRR